MTIKELDHDIECIPRLWNIGVVEKSVKEAFPDMEFRVYAKLHQLLMRVEAELNSKSRVPVMISVGGNFARTSGKLLGDTKGSLGFVPLK